MMYGNARRGFTLLEVLVVVLIIAVLAAVALPQYQKAVLKSRFTAMMPIAKTMADSNEAYYLEHGEYAEDPHDLPVEGQTRYPDGTELEFSADPDYAYVLASNSGVASNNYVVYQKHSSHFAGNAHCEAITGDSLAEGVCTALGGQEIGTYGDYTVYLLSGNSTGVFPKSARKLVSESNTCSAKYAGGSWSCVKHYAYNDGTTVDIVESVYSKYVYETDAEGNLRNWYRYYNGALQSANITDPVTGKILVGQDYSNSGFIDYTQEGFDKVIYDRDQKFESASFTDAEGIVHSVNAYGKVSNRNPTSGEIYSYYTNGQLSWYYNGSQSVYFKKDGSYESGESSLMSSIPAEKMTTTESYDVSQFHLSDAVDTRPFCEVYSKLC